MIELGGVIPKSTSSSGNQPSIGGVTPKSTSSSGNSPSIGGVTSTTKQF